MQAADEERQRLNQILNSSEERGNIIVKQMSAREIENKEVK
jgi:hypothetical protein